MIVEPGAFRTDFSGRSLQQSAEAIADYAETAGRRRKEHDTTDGTQPGDPAKAAEVIIEAALSSKPAGLLLLGQDALDGFRATRDGAARGRRCLAAPQLRHPTRRVRGCDGARIGQGLAGPLVLVGGIAPSKARRSA